MQLVVLCITTPKTTKPQNPMRMLLKLMDVASDNRGHCIFHFVIQDVNKIFVHLVLDLGIWFSNLIAELRTIMFDNKVRNII